MTQALAVTGLPMPQLDATFAAKADQLLTTVSDYEIDCPEVRALADKDLADAKLLLKKVEEVRKEQKAPYAAAAKSIDGYYDTAKTLLNNVISALTPKILTYDRKLAEERAAAQRAADEAARAERERLLAESKKAEAAGSQDAADALSLASTMVHAPVISTRVEKSEQSTSVRANWSAEVADLMTLVQAVAAGTVPLEAIAANAVYLNGRARLEKDKLSIPGVVAVKSETLARRAA